MSAVASTFDYDLFIIGCGSAGVRVVAVLEAETVQEVDDRFDPNRKLFFVELILFP